MKKFRLMWVVVLMLVLMSFISLAQSVIINEVSQGSEGNKEWVELLVVDNNVDMRGWELGDKDDGNWHSIVTFTNDAAWSNVASGTIIVIYNGGDVDGTISGEDTDFSDYKVIISGQNVTYFTDTGGWPGNGVFGNSDHDDCPAIRDDSDVIIHDMAVTHGSATVPGPGGGKCKYYTGNGVAGIGNDANWTEAASTSATPGEPNGGDNTTWVNSLRNPVSGTVISADINVATHWTTANSPYIIQPAAGNTINITKQLTIDAGVEVFFKGAYGLKFTGDGTLIADGTAANPIIFNSHSSFAGYWHGLYFDGAADPSLKHCKFYKAGNATADAKDSYPAVLYFSLVFNAYVDSVTISDFQQTAIYGHYVALNIDSLMIEQMSGAHPIMNLLMVDANINRLYIKGKTCPNNLGIVSSSTDDARTFEFDMRYSFLDSTFIELGGGGFNDNRQDTLINNIIANYDATSSTAAAFRLINFDPANTTRLYIKNNTFYNSVGNFYMEHVNSAKGLIKNNIFWGTGSVTIDGPWHFNNDIENPVAGNGEFYADPLFVDAANNDFHLQSNSPCVDTGYPTDDYSNEPAGHNGHRINVGAYGNTSEAATFGSDIDPGTVSGNWTKANSPYRIWGDINVSTAKGELRIDPGTTVYFKGSYKMTVGNGAKLIAVGTETDSITFTSSDADLSDQWIYLNIVDSGSDDSLVYCVFENAKGDYLHLKGGALYIDNSDTYIAHSYFRNNSPQSTYGGAVYFDNWSGKMLYTTIKNNGGINNVVYCKNSQCQGLIQYCDIVGNNGTGIDIGNSASISVKNTLIAHNTEYGVHIFGASALLENMTIADNATTSGVGVRIVGTTVLRNTIIYNNATSNVELDNTTSKFYYCNIEGGIAGFTGSGSVAPENNIGNIAVDPKFVNVANGDYHLQGGSPSIDAGDPNSAYSNEPADNGGRINQGRYGNTNEATTTGNNYPDWCNLQWPINDTLIVVGDTITYYGQVYEAGITNAAGEGIGIDVELGYGPVGTNPWSDPNWQWVECTYNNDAGNNDEYMGKIHPTSGIYDIAFRYRVWGNNWAYANDQAGTSPYDINNSHQLRVSWAGHLTSNTTWTKANSPYWVTGELWIDSGVTLTIEPGVVVMLRSANKSKYNGTSTFYHERNVGYIVVQGNMLAQGTVADSIIFTKDEPDSTDFRWGSLFFNTINDGGNSILKYCKIEYPYGIRYITGEKSYNYDSTFGVTCANVTDSLIVDNCKIENGYTGIYTFKGAFLVTNTEIKGMDYNGIYNRYGQPSLAKQYENLKIHDCHYYSFVLSDGDTDTVRYWQITNSEIYNNGYGIYVSGNSDDSIVVNNCKIHDLTMNYAVYGRGSAKISINNTEIYGCNYACNLVSNALLNVNNTKIYNCDYGFCTYDDVFVTGHNLLLYDMNRYPFKIEGNSSIDLENITAISSFDVLYYNSSNTSLLKNSILYRTSSPVDVVGTGTVDITYSCIKGQSYPGDGNITDDPLFVDLANDDYHLQVSSPCVDAGDPTSDYSNEPLPNGHRINMGYYGNTADATTTPGTDIDPGNVSGVWTKANSPYRIWGDITVSTAKGKLEIEPGVEVKFMGYYKLDVNANAQLVAKGAVGDSIKFTVADTTGFAAYPDSAIGGWAGIRFNGSGSDDTLKYCIVEYGKKWFGAGGGQADIYGGGVYFNNTNVYCSNSVIRNNSAYNGGGVHCSDANPTFSNVNINNNLAHYSGGGVYLLNSDAIFMDVSVCNNVANATGGGGMSFYNNSDAILTNCNIYSNSAPMGSGGGMTMKESNLKLQNTIISNNSCRDNGGGLHIYKTSPQITNVTIVKNSANAGGGLGCKEADPVIKNSIIWNNTAANNGDQVLLFDDDADPSFYYCDIEGGTAGFSGAGSGANYNGTYDHNIDLDPKFMGLYNYVLHATSPCINTGTPDTTGLDLPNTDLAGNPRIYAGWVNRIDMGAYEYQGHFSVPNFVINEVYYNSAKDAGCYTEIKGPAGYPLANMVLAGIDGANGTKYAIIDLNDYIMPNDGYFVIAQDGTVTNLDITDANVDWQNGPDAVHLDYGIKLVDAVAYGAGADAYGDGGTHAVNVSAGNSLSRIPDGTDTNNNANDFKETRMLTPGEPNKEALHVIGTVSGVWDQDTVFVDGNINVDQNKGSLIIKPGVVVYFTGKYQFEVGSGAQLIAIGAVGNSIKFTADPAVGWENIYFNDTGNDDTLKYCVFEYGKGHDYKKGTIMGGAVTIFNSTHTYISDCDFHDNGSSAVKVGGAIFIDGDAGSSTVCIENCNFEHNESQWGGAVYLMNWSGKILNCDFIENEAIYGIVYVEENTTGLIQYCFFNDNGGHGIEMINSNCAVKNSILINNDWGVYAGSGNMHLDNLVIFNNGSAGANGGLYLGSSAYAIIENCIIYGNKHTNLNVEGTHAKIYYSDVEGGIGSISGGGSFADTLGIIDADPQFVDIGNHDFHLHNTSPCVDAGDPTSDYSNEPAGHNGHRINIGRYGNTPEAATIGSDIETGVVSGTWEKANSPYRVWGDISVSTAKGKLEIKQGVVVKFMGHYRLKISGNSQLIAKGVQGDSIVFTVNDTMGFANTSVVVGGWNGLQFIGTSQNDTLEYCVIKYVKKIASKSANEDMYGAVYVAGTSGFICNNSLIENNFSKSNCGGIYIDNNSVAKIKNNTIRNNETIGNGGGIYLYNISQTCEMENNLINNNTASDGGGIYCHTLSNSVKIVNNEIVQNNAKGTTNAINGGGISINASSCEIKSNIIHGNFSSYEGGGVEIISSPNLVFEHNLVYDNSAGHNGGGLCFVSCQNLPVMNNTITSNTATNGREVHMNNSDLQFRNNIIWNNAKSNNIYLEDTNSDPDFYYCDGIDASEFSGPGAGANYSGNLVNNINSDPKFVDAANGDYHLQGNSPCIDTGDPTSDASQEPNPAQPPINIARINIGAYGGTNEATAADTHINWADTQWPRPTIDLEAGTDTVVYGQIYIAGVTNAKGAAAGVQAWLGYGPVGVLPTSDLWTWIPATYNTDVGNNDEYKATLSIAGNGNYDYCFKFTYSNYPTLYADLGGDATYKGTDDGFNHPGRINIQNHLDYSKLLYVDDEYILPIAAGGSDVYAIVSEAGLTNDDGTNANQLQVEMGYGAFQSDPAAGGWTWIQATYDSKYDANTYKYRAQIPAIPVNGEYSFSFRISLDGGATWSYADADGTTPVNPNVDVTKLGKILAYTPIYNIQGQTANSPFNGQNDIYTMGVVIGIDNDGTKGSAKYFIEDFSFDVSGGWVGLTVYKHSGINYVPEIGDSIYIRGSITEYNGLTEIKEIDWIKECGNVKFNKQPLVLTTNNAGQEKYESMFIKVKNAICTNDNLGYGEWEVDDGSGALRIDDMMYHYVPGVNNHYNVTGVMYYSYGNFKLEPRDANDVIQIGPRIENVTISNNMPEMNEDVVVTFDVADNIFDNNDITKEFVYNIGGTEYTSSVVPVVKEKNVVKYKATIDHSHYRYAGDHVAFKIKARENSSPNLTAEYNDAVDVKVFTGDVVINEIMQNPSAVSDDKGEWFEIYNIKDYPINMNGWTIKDNGSNNHVINNGGDLVIQPHSYMVFARNGNVAENGGVNADYVYGNDISLGNSSDAVILMAGGVVIDKVEYDNGATFPDPNGKSMALISPDLDNNVGANWLESTMTYGDGDYGTPGAKNFPDYDVAVVDLHVINAKSSSYGEKVLKVELKNAGIKTNYNVPVKITITKNGDVAYDMTEVVLMSADIGNSIEYSFSKEFIAMEGTYHFKVENRYTSDEYAANNVYETDIAFSGDTELPNKPRNLQVKDSGLGGTLDISWEEPTNSSHVAGYVLFYKKTTETGFNARDVKKVIYYSLTGLTNGSQYDVFVRAYNYSGDNGASSDTLSATPTVAPTPEPPQNVAAMDTPDDGGKSITITWDKSPSEDDTNFNVFPVSKYLVYRSETETGTYNLIGTVNAAKGDYSFVDNGVSDLVTYYYIVKAKNVFVSASSSVVNAEAYPNLPPATPDTLLAYDTPNDLGYSITLRWHISDDDIRVSYYILYKLVNGEWTDIEHLDRGTEKYIDEVAENGVDYSYKLTAAQVLSNGVMLESDPTNIAVAQALDDMQPPAAPTNVTAIDNPSDNGYFIKISWNLSANDLHDVLKYYIYMENGKSWVKIDSANAHIDNKVVFVNENNVDYTFALTAIDEYGHESSYSESATATALDNLIPSAPTSVKAVDTPDDDGHSITLTWTLSVDDPETIKDGGMVLDVEKYYIYRSESVNGTYTLLDSVNAGVYEYVDTQIADADVNNTEFWYYVRAYDGTYYSNNSNKAHAIPLNNAEISGVTNLTAYDWPNDNGGKIKLQWALSNDDAILDGYKIYRRIKDGGDYSDTPIATLNKGTSTYLDMASDLEVGVYYQYIVKAYIGNILSAASNEVTVRNIDNIAPYAPRGLIVIDNPNDQGGAIKLSWLLSMNDGSKMLRIDGNNKHIDMVYDVEKYRIYRKTGTSGTFYPIAEVAAGIDYYVDNTCDNEVMYYYEVKAVDHMNESSPSNSAGNMAMDNIAPAVPENLVADLEDDGTISLEWGLSDDDGAGANDVVGYQILRSIAYGYGYQVVGTVGKGVNTWNDYFSGEIASLYYKVRALDSNNYSEYSNVASVDYNIVPSDTIPPLPPQGLFVIDNVNKVKLSWLMSPDDPYNYYYKGGHNDVVKYIVQKVDEEGNINEYNVPSGITVFVDYNVIPGETYTYTVAAYDGNNESNDNPSVEIVIGSIKPQAPTNVRYRLAGNQLIFRWSLSADEENDGIAKYEIFLSNSDEDFDNAIASVDAGVSVWLHELTENGDYKVGVCAVGTNGVRSDTVSVTFSYVATKQSLMANNSPNPFNPITTINYQLTKPSYVKVVIYNASGQVVKVLVNEYKDSGQYSVVWNGRNANDESVSSGLYYYKITTKDETIIKSMLLIK